MSAKLLWAVLLATVVACAPNRPLPEPDVVDTFCLTARKRTWDPDVDSVPTMREAVVWNKIVDARCRPAAGKEQKG